MGNKKRTPTKRTSKKRSRGRPRKDRPKLDLSHRKHVQISNADKMKIVLLAHAGKTPSEIAELVGCAWHTAVKVLLDCLVLNLNLIYEKRWSDRTEEVLESGSVAPKQKSGRTPIFNTPEKRKKLYKKLRKTNVSKLSR